MQVNVSPVNVGYAGAGPPGAGRSHMTHLPHQWLRPGKNKGLKADAESEGNRLPSHQGQPAATVDDALQSKSTKATMAFSSTLPYIQTTDKSTRAQQSSHELCGKGCH